jgi:hypothetical protein
MLCPAINLINNIMPRPEIPRLAVLLDVVGDAHAVDIVRVDDQRREEAARRVPRDVAVPCPDACFVLRISILPVLVGCELV